MLPYKIVLRSGTEYCMLQYDSYGKAAEVYSRLCFKLRTPDIYLVYEIDEDNALHCRAGQIIRGRYAKV